MGTHLVVFAVLLPLLSGCPDEAPTAPFAVADTRDIAVDLSADWRDATGDGDLPRDVANDALNDGDSDSGPLELAPTDYCEATADAFCGFYLRCGRMAVPDEASCKVAFLQGCNGLYEPLYADLANRGLLSLSSNGVQACQSHLSTVACDQQVFDLDGPCGQMWTGQTSEGEACGPGLQSFVCHDATTCVLDLSFCGTCKPLAGPSETCDVDHRCRPSEHCEAGACVPRITPGAACDQDIPCVLGTGCVEGVCAADLIVGVGETCDAGRACAYKSDCSNGVCVGSSLNGETCSGVGSGECNSGWCDAGTCQPRAQAGQGCTDGDGCISGNCIAGSCGTIAFSCL